MTDDIIARRVAQRLLQEGKEGKREKIDVDDVREALIADPGYVNYEDCFEQLLALTLRRLVEGAS